MRAVPIVLVVAVAENGVIGIRGGLPWRLKADLRRFREVTMGKPLIMGRATYASIGRPLDGRDSIVLTRSSEFAAPGVLTAHDLPEALALADGRAKARDADEICVIGGAAVFRETLPLAARLHVTRIDGAAEGDVTFGFDAALWVETSREPLPISDGDTARGTYVSYDRAA